MSISTASATPKFKVVFIGDANCGKTAFVNMFRTGIFVPRYKPTLGVEVNALPIAVSSGGEVILNIWDCAGDEKYQGLGDGYYIGAQAAVIMFDLTNIQSFTSAWTKLHQLRRIRPNIPVVLCGNKADVSDRVITPEYLSTYSHLFSRLGIHYYDVSAKSRYNFEKPFLYLLRKLLNSENLVLL